MTSRQPRLSPTRFDDGRAMLSALSLARAVVWGSSRESGQKLARAWRLSQAHRNSTGFKSGEYAGKKAI